MTTRKPHQTGCLICGNADVYSRGLCQADYRHFMRRRSAIELAKGAAAAEKFETQCLGAGWIKPKSKGGRHRDENPLDAIADLFVADPKGAYTSAEAKEATAEGDQVIKKAVSKRGKNGGTKSNGKKEIR